MEKTFLNKIKYLALLSGITVVALNTCQGIEPVNEIDNILNNFLWDLVDNFSFIAYGFLYAMTGALLFLNPKESVKTKLLNIIKYIFSPYLIWQILISISKVTVLRQSFESLNFFRTVFLLIPFAPDGPLYHMYMAFILSMISLLIYPIISNKKYKKSLIIILSLSGLVSLSMLTPLKELSKITLLPSVLTYLPAFLLGTSVKEKDFKTVITFILLSLTLEGFTKGIFKTAVFMSIPYLILIVMDTPKKTGTLTRYSFLIYAIHPVFIAIICPIIQSLITSAFLANMLSIITVTILSIISSWIVYQFLKRTVPLLLPYITCNKD